MTFSHSKVPQVTLLFWVIKILATTLGETFGDALSMTLNLGYGVSSLLLLTLFGAVVTAQIFVRSFYPLLYWTVIVLSTTVGTTMADYADRSLGIGYTGGASILFISLMLVLTAWRMTVGSISATVITSRKAELFYWLTILFSQTLGTALGDFFADDSGLGYWRSALIFSTALACISMAYFFTKISHIILFWMAFILTRPLGATVGDFLTKPHELGGLDLGRFISSMIIFGIMIFCVILNGRKQKSSV